MWREEEEVRRGWREGCGEGFDWWMGGEGGDYRIPKNSEERDSGDERELDWWSVEALSSSSRNMVESGGDVFPAALCTREGAVAPLGLHARAGRRGGEAVRERGRRL